MLGMRTVYKDLDEVNAPADVPEAGVRVGDRGVVVAAFERPYPAVEVMYDDEEGEPGPCVVYSPDLGRVFSWHKGY